MATPLLTTKLYIPPVRTELVSRPRLIERLNAGLDRKLTLISAPAGFGKTTLLSEWVSASTRPVAWLSLDKGDNDPTRFWAYFIAALQTIHESVGEAALAMLQSAQPPSIEAVLTDLINEIAEIPDPFTLVLDDYHLIEAQPIHDGLPFLLDHLPPQAHLVISGRSDPPLPLSRLRGRGQLTELRTADLRFKSDEAAAFLNQVMGLGLSAQDVAALEARTEGWIVGLQMAALSMRGRDEKDVAQFIAAFTGSHRYVLDYLTDEVLLQQPESVQTFLLRTAILDRLTGPLCDAVTGGSDGQTMLEQLDAANLFIVPLDDERCWYRYHRLFTALLQSRLEQTQLDQVPVLHRRASEWYQKNGLISEAVSHALAANDAERVAHLVAGNALAMMDRGDLTNLVGQLAALPDEVVRSWPWLCVAHAWALAYAGQLDAVEPLLQAAEKALRGFGEAAESDAETSVTSTGSVQAATEAQEQHIAGYIAAIRADVAEFEGDMSRATELAHEALERLPEEDLMARSYVGAILSAALRQSGNLAAAADALAEASAISQLAGDRFVAMFARAIPAYLLALQGQLRKAMAGFRDAVQLSDKGAGHGGRRLPATGYAYTRMSGVLREWNDLEAAVRYAREGVELSKQWGVADVLIISYVELAKTLQTVGDWDGALDAMQQARQVAKGFSAWWVVGIETYEAWIRLAQGDVAAATRWAEESGLSVDDELTFRRENEYRTFARVLIAQGRLDEALNLLARLLKMVEAAGAMGFVIELLALQAMAHQAKGQVDQALTALERALTLAEPEGYVRTFVDEGEPMARLLYQAAERGIMPAYVGKLLGAFGDLTVVQKPTTKERASKLVEPLSEREIEILQLIAEGLTNREIGQRLFISPGTVKVHTSNIYGKLGIHSRTQALAQARALGILPST